MFKFKLISTITALFTLVPFLSLAQWQQTGITDFNGLNTSSTIVAPVLHKNKLFSHAYPVGLIVSEDNGVTWDSMPNSYLPQRVIKFISVGDSLYAFGWSAKGSFAYGVIHFSTDGGKTWVMDSGDMPENHSNKSLDAVFSQRYIQLVGRYFVAEFVSYDDQKNFKRHIDSLEWRPLHMLNTGKVQSVTVSNDHKLAWAGLDKTIKYSTDGANTWNEPTNSGLPPSTDISGIALTQTPSDTILIRTTASGKSQVYISSNGGTSWSKLDVTHLLGTNATRTGTQTIRSLFIHNSHYYISLDNSAKGQEPIVYRYSQKMSQWELDTSGFFIDAQGSVFIRYFTQIGGKLYAVPNKGDLCQKTGTLSLDQLTIQQKLLIFPTISQTSIHISPFKVGQRIVISNASGMLVLNETLVDGILDISHLNKGIYMVRILGDNNKGFTPTRFIKI